MGFMILETKLMSNPKGHIPVILGRSFLAITNALINCHNGLIKLSFRNLSVDLNIFNLENESNQPFDVNLIQDDVYEPIDLSDREFDIEQWMNQDYEEFEEVNEVAAASMEPKWEPPIEPLSRSLVEETLKIELKPLPRHLKYAYLGPSEILSIITSANLHKRENC